MSNDVVSKKEKRKKKVVFLFLVDPKHGAHKGELKHIKLLAGKLVASRFVYLIDHDMLVDMYSTSFLGEKIDLQCYQNTVRHQLIFYALTYLAKNRERRKLNRLPIDCMEQQ